MSKGKIFVVDDMQKNLDLVEDILTDEGYDVVLLKSGEKCLELLFDQIPDVILLDVMMPPGMNGIDVCREIKKLNSRRHIKVIMLTAKARKEDKLAGLEAGADDYIVKPYHSKELLLRVNIHCRTKQLKDKLKSSLSKAEHEADIGQMVTRIVHDFKNVLNCKLAFQSIKLNATKLEPVLKNQNDRKALENLDAIKDLCGNGINMTIWGEDLLNGLLAFAKGAGQEQKTQALSPLILFPLKIFSRRIKKWNIKVVRNIEDKEIFTKCNEGEMQRVALNLIDNALQSMEKTKTRCLTISIGEKENRIYFSISDSGVGIPVENQSEIYDNFFTTKEKGKGTGIGLATVQKIIHSHDGKINLESASEKGTTFTVLLPKQRRRLAYA